MRSSIQKIPKDLDHEILQGLSIEDLQSLYSVSKGERKKVMEELRRRAKDEGFLEEYLVQLSPPPFYAFSLAKKKHDLLLLKDLRRSYDKVKNRVIEIAEDTSISYSQRDEFGHVYPGYLEPLICKLEIQGRIDSYTDDELRERVQRYYDTEIPNFYKEDWLNYYGFTDLAIKERRAERNRGKFQNGEHGRPSDAYLAEYLGINTDKYEDGRLFPVMNANSIFDLLTLDKRSLETEPYDAEEEAFRVLKEEEEIDERDEVISRLR